MSVALVDPALLGADVTMVDDVDPVWGVSAGFACLARALARRLATDRGGLFYDLAYGYNVTDLLNAGWTQTLLQKAQQAIAAECRKDERVRRVKAQVAFNEFFQTLTITVTCDTDAGPFSMVMAATAVTVAVLQVNGVQVPTTAPTTPAAAGTTSIVVVEGGGAAGPPGPPGPGGSAQASITFGDAFFFDSSGAETWVSQREVSFDSLPGTLTVEFAAQVRTDSGTGTFRLRVGGGDEAADGTVLATITTTSTSYEEKLATASVSNPTGLKRLKITIESSGAASEADIKNVTVTLR